MAIALVWAPVNNVHCVFVLVFGLFIRTYFFDMSVMLFAMIAVCFEIFFATLAGLSMTSQVLHLMGAGLGFAIDGCTVFAEIESIGFIFGMMHVVCLFLTGFFV